VYFVLAGIYYSDDKLLQSRIFSYSDTQRHRLGPNYLLLPVNAPKSAHHNNHHEGFMNVTHRDEEVHRLLSCLQGCCSAVCQF
jgi:catalase